MFWCKTPRFVWKKSRHRRNAKGEIQGAGERERTEGRKEEGEERRKSIFKFY